MSIAYQMSFSSNKLSNVSCEYCGIILPKTPGRYPEHCPYCKKAFKGTLESIPKAKRILMKHSLVIEKNVDSDMKNEENPMGR